MKSIFKNAKIVGSNVPQPDYRKQPEGAVRGDPRWIMSRGELKDFALCPHKWIKNAMAHDESESTKWGNMLDCAVFNRFEGSMVGCVGCDAVSVGIAPALHHASSFCPVSNVIGIMSLKHALRPGWLHLVRRMACPSTISMCAVISKMKSSA